MYNLCTYMNIMCFFSAASFAHTTLIASNYHCQKWNRPIKFFSLNMFYCDLRTINMRYNSLINFSVYSSANYKDHSVQDITRNYPSCVIETLHPLISNCPFSPFPRSWQPLFYDDPMRLTILENSYQCGICPSAIGLVHLA